MKGSLEVRVEGTKVVHLSSSPPVAAKILVGAEGPILMMMGAAAGLLAGDVVRIGITLAPHSRLTVRSTAATIAYPCSHGSSTSLSVDCLLGVGAHLTWSPEPLVACGGCNHRGQARVALSRGATAVWLESVSLGRRNELPGQLELRLDVELDGHPLLRDGLRLAPGWDGPAVLSSWRHVGSIHLLGRRVPGDAELPGAMQLAGVGTTFRVVAHRGDALAAQLSTLFPKVVAFVDPRIPCAGPNVSNTSEDVQPAAIDGKHNGNMRFLASGDRSDHARWGCQDNHEASE